MAVSVIRSGVRSGVVSHTFFPPVFLGPLGRDGFSSRWTEQQGFPSYSLCLLPSAVLGSLAPDISSLLVLHFPGPGCCLPCYSLISSWRRKEPFLLSHIFHKPRRTLLWHAHISFLCPSWVGESVPPKLSVSSRVRIPLLSAKGNIYSCPLGPLVTTHKQACAAEEAEF